MAAWRKAKQDVELNVDRMEIMKPHIKRRYEAFQQAQARRKAEEDKLTQVERNNTYRALVGGAESISAASGRSSYGYGRTQQLDPTISSDLAVKLAHNEFRGAAFREAASDSRSPSIKSTSRSQKGLSHRGTFFSDDSDDDLSEQMMAVAQRREQAFARPESQESKDSKQHRTSSTNRAPKYPTIPKQIVQTDSTWYGDGSDSIPPPAISRSEIHSPSPAPIQPLTSDPHTIFHSPSPPPIRPPKEQLYASESPPPLPAKVRSPSPVEAPDTAVVDPRNYTFLTLATTESGRLLRTLFINPKVRSEFQNIALANTQRNLETCGILCGRLVSNAFFVSKLVIPEQESTSDTCDTVNEGALFDYCDSENLMTLGWIHTHPTQTCFLSSRDLHTHSGYQVQLAESIAIVCAPRHQPS
jgi:STAM-binding protein